MIYVGKAKNLRSRVRSYFLEANQINNRKTGSLMREAVDVDYIVVDNEREALALENNLIKQRKPRFNILLRDDKTYPYIKLTLNDRHPKVFVTRRLRKDGSAYFGPFFPGNLAHRLVDLIHRSFLIPSCKVDLNRYHPRACLQFYIKRCLGPCVEANITPEAYRETIRDVQLFLEGRTDELEKVLSKRMQLAAEAMLFEAAGKLRDQITTVHQMGDKQRIATTDNEDADVFGFHYENEMLAVNLFHMRGGKIVDRRDFFWEDLPSLDAHFGESLNEDESESEAEIVATPITGETYPEPVLNSHRTLRRPSWRYPGAEEKAEELADSQAAADCPTESSPALEPNPAYSAPEAEEDCAPATQHSSLGTLEAPAFSPAVFFSALLKQLYLDQAYVPRSIYVPVDFPDRALLADLLSERTRHRIELAAPQRGDKRSLVDLVCQTPSSRTTSGSACSNPTARPSRRRSRTRSLLPKCPSASSASISRTSRALRLSPRWSSGKTAR